MSVSYAERGGFDSHARYESRAIDESTRLFDGSECPRREAPVRKHGAALRGWWASGCSEVVSRCVRDAETAGSIPVTPTSRRAVHRAVMSILHVDCAGFESLALYDFPCQLTGRASAR